MNNLVTLCAWCHKDIHEGRLVLAVVRVLDNDLEVTIRRKS